MQFIKEWIVSFSMNHLVQSTSMEEHGKLRNSHTKAWMLMHQSEPCYTNKDMQEKKRKVKKTTPIIKYKALKSKLLFECELIKKEKEEEKLKTLSELLITL